MLKVLGEVKHFSNLINKSNERPLVVASECGLGILIFNKVES